MWNPEQKNPLEYADMKKKSETVEWSIDRALDFETYRNQITEREKNPEEFWFSKEKGSVRDQLKQQIEDLQSVPGIDYLINEFFLKQPFTDTLIPLSDIPALHKAVFELRQEMDLEQHEVLDLEHDDLHQFVTELWVFDVDTNTGEITAKKEWKLKKVVRRNQEGGVAPETISSLKKITLQEAVEEGEFYAVMQTLPNTHPLRKTLQEFGIKNIDVFSRQLDNSLDAAIFDGKTVAVSKKQQIRNAVIRGSLFAIKDLTHERQQECFKSFASITGASSAKTYLETVSKGSTGAIDSLLDFLNVSKPEERNHLTTREMTERIKIAFKDSTVVETDKTFWSNKTPLTQEQWTDMREFNVLEAALQGFRTVVPLSLAMRLTKIQEWAEGLKDVLGVSTGVQHWSRKLRLDFSNKEKTKETFKALGDTFKEWLVAVYEMMFMVSPERAESFLKFFGDDVANDVRNEYARRTLTLSDSEQELVYDHVNTYHEQSWYKELQASPTTKPWKGSWTAAPVSVTVGTANENIYMVTEKNTVSQYDTLKNLEVLQKNPNALKAFLQFDKALYVQTFQDHRNSLSPEEKKWTEISFKKQASIIPNGLSALLGVSGEVKMPALDLYNKWIHEIVNKQLLNNADLIAKIKSPMDIVTYLDMWLLRWNVKWTMEQNPPEALAVTSSKEARAFDRSLQRKKEADWKYTVSSSLSEDQKLSLITAVEIKENATSIMKLEAWSTEQWKSIEEVRNQKISVGQTVHFTLSTWEVISVLCEEQWLDHHKKEKALNIMESTIMDDETPAERMLMKKILGNVLDMYAKNSWKYEFKDVRNSFGDAIASLNKSDYEAAKELCTSSYENVCLDHSYYTLKKFGTVIVEAFKNASANEITKDYMNRVVGKLVSEIQKEYKKQEVRTLFYLHTLGDSKTDPTVLSLDKNVNIPSMEKNKQNSKDMQDFFRSFWMNDNISELTDAQNISQDTRKIAMLHEFGMNDYRCKKWDSVEGLEKLFAPATLKNKVSLQLEEGDVIDMDVKKTPAWYEAVFSCLSQKKGPVVIGSLALTTDEYAMRNAGIQMVHDNVYESPDWFQNFVETGTTPTE